VTPAGARFDKRLGEIIEELRAKSEVRSMPEVGGKKLATDFSSMMADVRQSIEESKSLVAAAVAELKAEIATGAQGAAKALRAEAADVRKGYAELLGNNPPETGQT
jgi:hypothetical protein